MVLIMADLTLFCVYKQPFVYNRHHTSTLLYSVSYPHMIKYSAYTCTVININPFNVKIGGTLYDNLISKCTSSSIRLGVRRWQSNKALNFSLKLSFFILYIAISVTFLVTTILSTPFRRDCLNVCTVIPIFKRLALLVPDFSHNFRAWPWITYKHFFLQVLTWSY